jgi:hypothetical protein
MELDRELEMGASADTTFKVYQLCTGELRSGAAPRTAKPPHEAPYSLASCVSKV